MSETESKLNPIFEKLQKKFQDLQLKKEADKVKTQNQELSDRFELTTKNLENNIFNLTLYNVHSEIKEMPLTISISVCSDLEEYMYLEYLRMKYPYSSVTVSIVNSSRQVKLVLLDEDREKFLFARGFAIEQKMIPETYFVPRK